MTVSSTITRRDYDLTGGFTSCPYNFKVFEAADLKVTKRNIYGIETILALGTDYTVTGAGTEGGGEVLLTSAGVNGEHITIQRNLTVTQMFAFRGQKDFYAERHENAYDRIVMLIQQQSEASNRAILLPTTFIGSSTIVNLIPGYALGIAADGLSVQCVPNTGANQSADLANTVLAAKGAGLIGYTYALAYAAGTVGKELKDQKDADTALALRSTNLENANLVNCKVPVRQTALAGAVDANGAANFMAIGSGLAVSLAATAVPVVVAFAAGFGSTGELDFVGRATADLATAWSALTPSTTLYLYVDRNVGTGALTYGFTALAPTYGYGTAKSIVAGQHTYRIDEGVMYVGNGSTAAAVQRVFLGECVTGAAAVTSVITYALMGKFIGALSAVPGTSTATIYAHNIGVNLIAMDSRLVCLTADASYLIGDEVPLRVVSDSTGISSVFSESATARNGLRVAAGTTAPYLRGAAGGALAAITAARWNIRPVATRSF